MVKRSGIIIEYGKKFNEKPRSSKAIIQPGIFKELPDRLAQIAPGHDFVIITDTNVMALFGHSLFRTMKNHGQKMHNPIVIEPGENSKDVQHYVKITDELSEKQLGRYTVIIALGGGVVGDLAGFAASTYERGISYVQVPTTLLAQVDSSIGGKVGINTKHGKNLLGRFKLPLATFIDPELLETLDISERVSGLAEIIKYGVLDKRILDAVEQNTDIMLACDAKSLTDIINMCVSLKTAIVDKDPKDRGMRQALNFGHTIGHGLEKASGYTLSHGEAIAIGMHYEGAIAAHIGIFRQRDTKRLKALLEQVGLPVLIPNSIDVNETLYYMRNDKKNENNKLKITVPKKFGNLLAGGYGFILISESEIKTHLLKTTISA